MAYLYRLIAWALLGIAGTFILLLPLKAQAAFPATADPSVCSTAPCYIYRVPANTAPDRGVDAAAACQAYVAGLVNPPYAFQYNSTSYPNCNYGYRIGSDPWTNGFAEMSRVSVVTSTTSRLRRP